MKFIYDPKQQKEILLMIDDCEEKIRQQEQVCHDTTYGKFGHKPVDYDCGCGNPDFTYDSQSENYSCNTCGHEIQRGSYTEQTFLRWR